MRSVLLLPPKTALQQKVYTIGVTRELADEFAQQAYLKAFNAEDNDQFGFSISLSDDTLAVGAVGKNSDVNNDIDVGAVYVFTRDIDGYGASRPTSRPPMPRTMINSGSRSHFRVTPLRSGRSAKTVLTTLNRILVRSMCLPVTSTGIGHSRPCSGPLMPRTMINSGFRYHFRMTPLRSVRSARTYRP